jgi:carboxyl-terminal processing protease
MNKLGELMKAAREERYYELARTEFDSLELKLTVDKEKDLETFKDEIKQMLREEIISRYYYQ